MDDTNEASTIVEPTEPASATYTAPTAAVGPEPIISEDAWLAATAEWINSCVRNSPIAQSVEAWNHLGLIIPKLREFLETRLRG